jgi:hypothetical protein
VGSHSALAPWGGFQGKRLIFQNRFIPAKILFPANIYFPPKTAKLVIFPAHLHVAMGLQLLILNKHGGKEFPSNENYVILGRKFFF